MYAIEVNDDIYILDCGLKYPENELLGKQLYPGRKKVLPESLLATLRNEINDVSLSS